jgi:CYTH domain-containing protein
MPDDAAALGWPNLKYVQIERERRWLCKEVPWPWVIGSSFISDLYVSETQLRVRAVRDLSTDEVVFKLTRKGDLAPSKRLITTIYLANEEHELLSQLPGRRLTKIRHSVQCPDGTTASVDVFSGALVHLVMAEWEFETDHAMEAYQPPSFVGPEVTNDRRYSGGHLAGHGTPSSYT